jgi:two-component system phosphate regulon response regulator PhoB
MNEPIPNGSRGLVLIVEDEESILSSLAMLVELEGYRVAQASDGQQALQRIAECRPDLLLTDFMMPQLDGIELVRRLRAEPAYQELPIILMSAVRVDLSGVEALVDAFLRKPMDLDHMFELIERGVTGGRAAMRAGR